MVRRENGIDPGHRRGSIMPCTAKSSRWAERPVAAGNGIPDCDIALTTRSTRDRCAISTLTCCDEEFDDPLGESSGAGVIFGATGGVMEAALRTAVETLGQTQRISTTAVRGTESIKEATLDVAACG